MRDRCWICIAQPVCSSSLSARGNGNYKVEIITRTVRDVHVVSLCTEDEPDAESFGGGGGEEEEEERHESSQNRWKRLD